jgi:hypothetical protein
MIAWTDARIAEGKLSFFLTYRAAMGGRQHVDRRDAVQTITCGLTAMRSTGTTMWMPLWLSYLTKANAEIGQFDDARRRICEAMAAVEMAKEKWCEAEVNRIAGKIALLSLGPDAARAEECFERALAVARAQQFLGIARCDKHGAAVARSGQAG